MKVLITHLSLASALFCCSSLVAAQGMTQECLTEEVLVDDTNSWLVTDESCNIGDGMWGLEPQHDAGTYWLQCGYFSQMPKSWFAKELSTVVPLDKVVMQLDGDSYRCLIGPFSSYNKASKLKAIMRPMPNMKNVFIREVTKPNATAERMHVNLSEDLGGEEIIEVVDSSMDAAVPVSTETVDETEIITDKPKTVIVHQDFYQIGEIFSPVPSEGQSNHIEENKPWLRASYSDAKQLCADNKMTLVSEESLRAAAEDPDLNAFLPRRLPFWVQGDKAFDVMMMVPVTLTPNSAIYVFCE